MAIRSGPTASDRRAASGSPERTAFTLAELAGVFVILSVLAIGAIPALQRIQRIREGALAREVQRRLVLARSWAASTGRPTGLEVDVAANTLTLWRIQQDGDPPAPLPNSTGDGGAPWRVGSHLPGAIIIAVTHGDGAAGGGGGVLWFGPDGEPQLRDDDGAYVGPFTQDASIAVSGGFTVAVRRLTGMIER